MKFCSLVAVALAAIFGCASASGACRLCYPPQRKTLVESIESSDAAAFAKLVRTEHAWEFDHPSTLRAAKSIMGGTLIRVGEEVEYHFLDDPADYEDFLLVRYKLQQKDFHTVAIGIPKNVKEYVRTMTGIPKDDVRRLLHAFQFLEGEDDDLREESYGEFAKCSYKEMKALSGKLDRDQLVAWIEDPQVRDWRKRLYFILLSLNGSQDDLPMLAKMVETGYERRQPAFDAIIACYLQLGGIEALSRIERDYLINDDVGLNKTCAVLRSLRFHVEEDTDAIPRNRLIQSFRLLLGRPQLADVVVADLARFQDWESMPQLVALFENSAEKDLWLRNRVASYLKTCPLPEAKDALARLRKVDARAVGFAKPFCLEDND